MLREALYVITENLAGLVFASQEVPQGAWLSVSPLEMIAELFLEVGPPLDGAFPEVVLPIPSQIREVDWEILNHERCV